MKNKFPINVFHDVDSQNFFKNAKKAISEDIVAQNFRIQDWKVYKPFVDTGIDLIIKKTIINSDKSTVEITRFVQIKTRKLVEKNIFGYTLSPKDFRDDPRHVFLFFCDTTNDYIIIPILDYLTFFSKNKKLGMSNFGTTSFRKENNKINSLKYNVKTEDESAIWSFSKYSWDQFVNEEGLKNLENAVIDNNLIKNRNKVNHLKNTLMYDISFEDNTFKKSFKNFTEEKKEYLIDKIIESFKSKLESDALERKKLFSSIDKNLQKSNSKLYKSHLKYLQKEEGENE